MALSLCMLLVPWRAPVNRRGLEVGLGRDGNHFSSPLLCYAFVTNFYETEGEVGGISEMQGLSPGLWFYSSTVSEHTPP